MSSQQLGERVMALEVKVNRMEMIEKRLAKMEHRQAMMTGGLAVLQFLLVLWLKY